MIGDVDVTSLLKIRELLTKNTKQEL